jgi:acetyltransferase-like isoleucine patch superfamily enzyme
MEVKRILGKDVLLAAYCLIGSDDHKGAARVDDGVWLGVRVKVPSGTRVGHDAIMGAHAVVEQEIQDWAIAVGRPAAMIRLRPGS